MTTDEQILDFSSYLTESERVDGNFAPDQITEQPSDEDVGSLLSGYIFSYSSISYSFPNTKSDYDYYPDSGIQYSNPANPSAIDEILDGYEPATSAQKSKTEIIFSLLEGYANLDFDLVEGVDDRDADINIAVSNTINDGTGTYRTVFGGAIGPEGFRQDGDVWINHMATWKNPVVGNNGFQTLAHEIGHTLGLKHPFEPSNQNSLVLDANLDSYEYTLMTYKSFVNDNYIGRQNETYGFPQTFMMLDIAALQFLYGANFSYNIGNTTYSFDPNTGEMFVNGSPDELGAPGGNRIFRTLWDGDGEDTYDLSNYTTDLSINLNPGEGSVFSQQQLALLNATLDPVPGAEIFASANLYNALQYDGDNRSLIENAIGGSGDDTLLGNMADNDLRGGTGDDTIDGGTGSGADALRGNGGDDELLGRSGSDELLGGGGSDVLNGGPGSDELDGGTGNDLLSGSDGDDVVFGDDGDDQVNGNDGNDELFGGADSDIGFGGAGNDRLEGGTGDDALNGGEDDDVVLGQDGHDTVNGGTGNDEQRGGSGNDSLSGDLGEDEIYGEGDDDRLFGQGGDDFLDGGAGNDILVGGFRDDTLVGGTGADRFNFGGNFFDDTVEDFTPGEDQLLVVSTIYTDISELNPTQIQEGLLLTVSEGGSVGTITLLGLTISDIFDGDIIFDTE